MSKSKNYSQDFRVKAVSDFFTGLFESLQDSRFSLKDQVFFAKRLSFLINAGIPAVEGLTVLREQMNSKGKARMLDLILLDVTNGQTLAKSFAKFPNVFSDFTIHIIKVGESSGTLSQNLEYLAEELKKKQILRRKIIGACIYPAFITAATLGITAFLMLYLFPKITPIFISLHTALPLPTRVVMSMSVFFQNHGLLVVGLLALLVFCFSVALQKSNIFHTEFDRAMLKVPVVGSMVQCYNIANVSRTLGLLLKSGVRLSEALSIAADTTKNLIYKQECKNLGDVVARGENISSHVRTKRNIFPDIFSHMVAVGEKSGTLSTTLTYLSEMYENEVDDFTKNFSTLIEPALMICMGLLVGFIAISIITPIYGITKNLHG